MNPYERAARLEKVSKLEHALVAAWEALPAYATAGRSLATAVETAPDGDDLWKQAARQAGVREPSSETKALVVSGLRRRERFADPFALFGA